jgi:hypothetical protein
MSLTESAYQNRRWARAPQLRRLLESQPLAAKWVPWSTAAYDIDEQLLDGLHVFKVIDSHREFIAGVLSEPSTAEAIAQELHLHAERLTEMAGWFQRAGDSVLDVLKTAKIR